MPENKGKSEVFEALLALRKELRKMTPLETKSGNHRSFLIEFDKWQEIASEEYSPSEYALFIETALAYAFYGYVPKGCEGSFADTMGLKPVEKLISKAFFKFKDSIDRRNRSQDSGSTGGKSKGKNKGSSDSTDGNENRPLPPEFNEENPLCAQFTDATADKLDYRKPVRCQSPQKLKQLYDRIVRNAPVNRIDRTWTDADWEAVFHYIDNNEWRIGKEQREIRALPESLGRAVKWAWNNISKERRREEERMKRMVGVSVGQPVQPDPSDSLRMDEEIKRCLAERFGPSTEQ